MQAWPFVYSNWGVLIFLLTVAGLIVYLVNKKIEIEMDSEHRKALKKIEEIILQKKNESQAEAAPVVRTSWERLMSDDVIESEEQ